jgi:hypothetical protein
MSLFGIRSSFGEALTVMSASNAQAAAQLYAQAPNDALLYARPLRPQTSATGVDRPEDLRCTGWLADLHARRWRQAPGLHSARPR